MKYSFTLDEKTKITLIFVIKWLFLAIIAGTAGTLIVHSFDFLYQGITRLLKSLLIPLPVWSAAGALVVGGIIYRLEPQAVGEGLPSYMRGLRQSGGRLRFSETVFKYAAALGTLATFGNGGIVGPLGRVSSGVMSEIGKRVKRIGFNEEDIRTATICGLAAAVGAIFHSAVGGGIFAVEVIEKAEMRYRDLFPAILSSAIAVFICKALGWFPFYPINAVDQFMDLGIAGWLLVTMVLAGFLGKVFNNLYVFVARVIRRENIQRIVLKVLVGTLIASWLGFFINPDLMGTSNELIQALFDNNKEQIYGNLSSTIPFFWVLLLLILVKASANCITVGSGMSAGFTGPAVILGMLLGALMANVVGVSHASANYYAFMAAGFSGMLASSMNVPIAAAVITIESFGLQYGIPAGFAAIIGFQTNRAHTIYDFAISTEFSGDQEN